MRRARAESGMITFEAMVGLGLIGTALAGLAAFMIFSGKAQIGVEQSSQIFRLSTDVRSILGSVKQCSNNFNGGPPPTDYVDAPLKRFDLNNAPLPGPPVIQSQMTYQDIRVASAGVRPRTQIAADLYLMDYEWVVDRGPRTGIGAQSFTIRIPFTMQTELNPSSSNYGKVTSCFMDPFAQGNAGMGGFICKSLSQAPGQPPLMFDPGTQKCVENFTHQKVPGDLYSANCPDNSKVLSCKPSNTNGTGASDPVYAQMDNGQTTPITAPGTFGQINGNSCICDYSQNYVFSNPPTEVCTADCAVLKTYLVNLWQQPAVQ